MIQQDLEVLSRFFFFSIGRQRTDGVESGDPTTFSYSRIIVYSIVAVY